MTFREYTKDTHRRVIAYIKHKEGLVQQLSSCEAPSIEELQHDMHILDKIAELQLKHPY